MASLRDEMAIEATRLISGKVDEFLVSGGSVELVAAKLDGVCAQSLDELCPALVDEAVERLTHALEELLESLFYNETGRERLFGMAEQASLAALSEEAGHWSDLPETERRRICDRVGRYADVMLRRLVPAILDELDLGTMVERRILRFSPREIEDVAISTAKTEMKYIEAIGGLAGAAAAAGLQLFRILFA